MGLLSNRSRQVLASLKGGAALPPEPPRPGQTKEAVTKTAADFVIPDGATARDFSVEQTVRQIGNMNILSISGGRVNRITSGNRVVGISLPVAQGYAVNVFLMPDDLYLVQRVFRGTVKAEQSGVYSDEVGEVAYQAGMYHHDWGGHVRGSKTAAAVCIYNSVSDNHSEDLLAVHHGRPEPTYICGYHEQRWSVPGAAGSPLNSDGSAKVASKTAMPSPADLGVSVGDHFYTSWGYDQTNVEFYEVTALTGASVKVREVAVRTVGNEGGPSESIVPEPGSFVGPEMTKRLLNSGSDRAAIKINESAYGWLWDGNPKSRTGYGWGH